MIKKIYSLCFLMLFFNGYTQEFQLSKNTTVSVLTIGTAEPSYALYGHTAIRFNDLQNNLDIVYNYGAFDFDTEYFILKFVKGDLRYFVTSSSYVDFENNYIYENRSIYEQKLNLTQKQKQSLFTQINSTIYSNDRYYTYKFIDRNCTTMIIDKINHNLGDNTIKFQHPVKESYRSILFPYAKDQFFLQLGINLIFGTKVDQKGTKLFLPLDLMQELKSIKVNGKPLVQETKTLFEAQNKNKAFSYFDNIYVLLLFLGSIILINSKKLTLIYFTIIGFLGVFFCGIGLYSFHQEVLWNYNALLLNPFYLVFVFFFIQKNKAKLVKTKWFLVIMLFIYSIVMVNKIYLVSVLPIIVTNLVLLFRLQLKNQSN